ncbi:MAG: lipopolysaccharide biosynthesis protein [Mariprofundaceae bacterium]|nr:lipopolysaccharide biosynthesis protein [Mariprofundaceae bacterium]
MSLSRRVFKGGAWASLAFTLSRMLGLLRLTILARLLLPDDFGLMTIVMMVVASMWVLSDMGTSASVIQRSNLNRVFMHTAWHINWLRGFILAALCWLSAPWLALFFEHPDLQPLLQWAALIPLIQGLESLGMVLLKRELNFRQRAYVDFAKESANTIVAILLVLYWHASAEAMLWGVIAGTCVASILSYFLHDYRPSLQFSREAAWDIWSYGGHLMGAGILIFAMTNLDDVIIGKILGIEQLGYYGVAFALAGILTNQLVTVFNAVMFPALSEIQHDYDRMKRVLGHSARLMSGVLTPVVCFVAIFPENLIEFIFGSHWLPAAPVLLVLLCMGWVRGIATVFGPVLLARKRSAVIHRMKWMEFGLFICTIIPAVYYLGIVGAALVLLVVYILSLILHVLAVRQELSGGMRKIVAGIGYGAVPGVTAFICAVATASLLPDERLLLIGILFLTVWGVFLWLREGVFIKQLLQMAGKR